MLRKAGVLAGTLFLLVFAVMQPRSALAARAAPLYTPEPIAVGKVTPERVRTIVRKSLLDRGWIPRDQGPGLIIGTLMKQRHKVVINIKYDGRYVRITYRDSDALNYKKKGDKEVIHPSYNKWVQNVETQISFSLAQLD